MPKDPSIAIRDCLAEIEILQDIAARTNIDGFRTDPIACRAAAYAIQIISEAVSPSSDGSRLVPHQLRHGYYGDSLHNIQLPVAGLGDGPTSLFYAICKASP